MITSLMQRLGVAPEQYRHGDIVVTSPIDGSELGRLTSATPDQVDEAIAKAQQAFLAWRRVPAPRRGELVRLFGEQLRRHKEDLGALVTWECGKILQEGLGEVQEMIDMADFAVGLSRQLYGLSMHSERPGHRMYEQWHPLGPVGVITIAFEAGRSMTDEINLLTILAEITGNAIHRAQLYDQSQRQVRRLTSLRDIDAAIASSFDLRLTLNILMDHTLSHLNVDAANIGLYHPDLRTLTYLPGVGFKIPSPTRPQVRIGEGLTGQVILRQQTCHITNLQSAKQAGEILMGFGAKNVLITHGVEGAYLITPSGAEQISIPQIQFDSMEKDSTGCGDQVMATVCAFLADGRSVKEAAHAGVIAGTLQFHRSGIVPVTRKELEQFIK